MNRDVKEAFARIRAEDKLKATTMRFIMKEIAGRRNARKFKFKRYAIVFVSAFLIVASGIFTYNLYYTPAAYVDVDVNPSIELTLNDFDVVIGSRAYNDDGVDVISGVSLNNKSYDEALFILMETMAEQGYFNASALVSVTLQTDHKEREAALLSDIQSGIESYLSESHHAAEVDVFSISSDTRNHSAEQGVSPAKYLAIQELIQVDPTASMENCRHHSISEIKRLAREHGEHHAHSDAEDGEHCGGNGCGRCAR